MENRLASRILSVGLAVMAVAGCGGGGGVAPVSVITRLQGGTVSFGNLAKIVIPPNSLAQDTAISVRPFVGGNVPPAPAGMAVITGTLFDFQPSGVTFSPDATMTIAYDPAALPANVAASSLRICTVVNGAWVDVGGQVDTVAHTVTVPVSHFSIYAILGIAT